MENQPFALTLGESVSISGTFYRHVAFPIRSIEGSAAGGRWAPRRSFPVIYLARPREATIAEAYRLLVDSREGMPQSQLEPRRCFTCTVSVSQILDLRDESMLKKTGLGEEDLLGDHKQCQRVGSEAHDAGFYGVLAPSASGIGETLALFEDQLPAEEMPSLVSEEIWLTLPERPNL